jgi:Major Facilitator Superfamily
MNASTTPNAQLSPTLSMQQVLGGSGLLIGMAQAGTTYAVIYGVIARNVDASKRSWAMGITAATGSFGQFLMVPVEDRLISGFGWQDALLILSVTALAIIPLSFGLREKATPAASAHAQSISEALREAFAHKSYMLLTAGYFVCGFQVVFIGVHMPSYLKDQGLSPQVATYSLALIGLFNIAGTYAAGVLGQRMPKRWILSAIYLARDRDHDLRACAADADVGLRLLGGDGHLVAVDGAADERLDRADVRRAVHVDARRRCVPKPPDRLVPRRVARRAALRRHRELHGRVVDLGRARFNGCSVEPAGARARGGPHPDSAGRSLKQATPAPRQTTQQLLQLIR